MLDFRLVATPVVAFPALSPDVGEGAHAWIVGMPCLFALRGVFLTLGNGIETESIGKGLAIDEGGRVEIDAPLHVALRCFREQIGGIANGCAIAIERASDIDFLIGCGAKRYDEFEQNAVGTRFELLTLMVENDVLVAGATAENAHERKHQCQNP